MQTFISFHPSDIQMRNRLTMYLAILEKDKILLACKDHQINSKAESESISLADDLPELVIVLLSPDYLVSDYLHDKEFKRFLRKEEEGELITIAILLEPCNWSNTLFEDFCILPQNSNAISDWENKDWAFKDVIWNIEQLIYKRMPNNNLICPDEKNVDLPKVLTSVELGKFSFIQELFKGIKQCIRRTQHTLNLETEILTETTTSFRCLIINRHTNAESILNISIAPEKIFPDIIHSPSLQLNYSIDGKKLPSNTKFILPHDGHSLFWILHKNFSGLQEHQRYSSREIVKIIWEDWLKTSSIL